MKVTLNIIAESCNIEHGCNMPNTFDSYDWATKAEARRQWSVTMFAVLALNKFGSPPPGAQQYITLPSKMNDENFKPTNKNTIMKK